jgi:hypothetical protein
MVPHIHGFHLLALIHGVVVMTVTTFAFHISIGKIHGHNANAVRQYLSNRKLWNIETKVFLS